MIGNFHLREGVVEFRWKRWRNKKRQEVSSCLMVLFSGIVLLGAGGVALAGPTGGQITGGAGSINQTGSRTNVSQTSNVLSINWQDFSIGANEAVNFLQPGATSIAINRVIGGVPSYLAGALNANGRVFILNSAGITFTGTSHVNVGALLATTAMTINGDPTQAASYSGSGYGAVVNQGTISISNGGFAILAAPYVQNAGFIKAELGTIALAGTNQFTLDLSGTALIKFTVPAGTVEQIVNDGKTLGVDNSGTLQARSGQVIISANVASEVVNAVVNLNGVVDAEAFAPNGTGGSVLVTSEGDINLGGMIAAQGNDTGAGGQIATRAAGMDNVEARASLNAAGAPGKGGQIEVSGKTVKLNGNIDPGSGGKLTIDPSNVTITTAKGFNNIAGSTVSEAFISKQLKHNVSVDIQASHDIIFNAAGASHVLVGGDGNLTLDAASDILFNAANYVIQTKGGDVTLTAGGAIGDPAHRLSVVSGGPGVKLAGDIVLSAGNDIDIDSITIDAAGKGHVSALFSANAGGSFSAAGPIDVEALAKGKGSQQASAVLHIAAGNDVVLHGLTDIASVHPRGKGSNLAAIADVALTGENIADTGNVDVEAIVTGHIGHAVLAEANLTLEATSAVQINGNMTVTALGNLSNASSVAAHALAEMAGSHVTVTGAIDVEALASDRGAGEVAATALLNVQAFQGATFSGGHFGGIVNLGSITDKASAQNAGGGPARGLADAAILTATFGQILATGPINVSANADNSGGLPAGSAGIAASANADLTMAGGLGTPSGFHHPDVTVTAHGTNAGSGGVEAHARFALGGSGGVSLGNVVVDAVALNDGSHALGDAVADASFLTPHDGSLVLNSVNVQALASNGGVGGAQALAIGSMENIVPTGGGQLTSVAGALSIGATAITGPNAHANASALASLSFAGLGDVPRVAVRGPINVEALASDHGSGNAVASAHAKLKGNGSSASVAIGPLSDIANANNWGGGAAMARANVMAVTSTDLPGLIAIDGDVLVGAHANDVSGNLASANAELAFGFFFTPGQVFAHGQISVISRATNDQDGDAKSRAAIDVSAPSGQIASSIHLSNLLVDALASEQKAGAASASALTDIRAQRSPFLGHSASGDITMGSLVDRASAVAFSGGTAKSLADVTLQAAGPLHVAGSIHDSANAQVLGGAPSNGVASANAALAILSSDNVTVDGNIEVLGHAAGAPVDTAQVNAIITANLTTGSIFINGQITDIATASGGSDHAFAALKMNAHNITSGGELGLGDPILRARAGSAVAEWLTDSSGTAASGGAFVRVNIPPGF